MKPVVLFVDDDNAALLSYARLVRNMVEVRTATTVAAARVLLKDASEVAAVVTEAVLPDGSGLAVLEAVAAQCPDALRLVLTSSAEVQVAADAVNAVGLFRFLQKPCKPEVFIRAVGEALAAHLRARRERELREQAGEGIVEFLSGFMTGNEPELPAHAAELRRRAKEVAQAMKLPFTADLEIGAMLIRLGVSTIPKHVRDKLHAGERLEPAEADLMERIPEVVAHMIGHIPRLRGVVEILRHEATVLVQDPDAPRAATRKDVPLAARILRALNDIFILEEFGLTTSAALIRIREVVGRYDSDVLRAIEHLYADPNAMAAALVEELMVVDLVSGLVLAKDALSREGVPLISKGTSLTASHVEHLRLYAELGELVEPLSIYRREERPAPAGSGENATVPEAPRADA